MDHTTRPVVLGLQTTTSSSTTTSFGFASSRQSESLRKSFTLNKKPITKDETTCYYDTTIRRPGTLSIPVVYRGGGESSRIVSPVGLSVGARSPQTCDFGTVLSMGDKSFNGVSTL